MEKMMELTNRLAEVLPPKRYFHTLGVAYTSACLAMRYGCDRKQAQLAGLLHDCAKYLTDEQSLAECGRFGIPVTEWEKQAPYLLHAKLGAWYAKSCYGVDDEEILSAIRVHTTGKPDMTLLEQIVFVADYMEPGRRPVPGLEEVRLTAFCDLDEAALLTLSGTLSYLERTAAVIDPATKATLEYYNKKKQKKVKE